MHVQGGTTNTTQVKKLYNNKPLYLHHLQYSFNCSDSVARRRVGYNERTQTQCCVNAGTTIALHLSIIAQYLQYSLHHSDSLARPRWTEQQIRGWSTLTTDDATHSSPLALI